MKRTPHRGRGLKNINTLANRRREGRRQTYTILSCWAEQPSREAIVPGEGAAELAAKERLNLGILQHGYEGDFSNHCFTGGKTASSTSHTALRQRVGGMKTPVKLED